MAVSAVPVREALRRLEGENLVKFEANIGAIVAPISIEDLRDVYETRKIVESAAVRVGVERNTIAKAKLKDVITQMSSAYLHGEHDASYRLHREFHHLIVDTKSQPRLHAMTLSLLDASDRYLRLAPGLPTEASVLVKLHTDIADAILSSDAQAAYDAMVRHMNYSLDRLDTRNFAHHFPPLESAT
jgi:DNA-binding GntR family transcriptional regulator